jgi:hypothetical protein
MSPYEPKTVYWENGHIPTVDNILKALGYSIELGQVTMLGKPFAWSFTVKGPKGTKMIAIKEGELLVKAYGLILQWVLS